MSVPESAVPGSNVPPSPLPVGGGKLLGTVQLFPPAGIAVLASLRRFRELPALLQAVLSLFVASQLLAALWAPQVTLSLALALLRGVVVTGWVTYGFVKGRHLNMGWVAGALAVVSLLALALAGWLRDGRALEASSGTGLEFLYITANGMSIVGMVMIFLALLGLRHWSLAWRTLLGTLGAGVLILGMGKTAWLAVIFGLVLALTGRWATWLRWGLLGVMALMVTIPEGRAIMLNTIGTSLSGREQVWADAARISTSFSVGGTGPYQYGHWAAPFGNPCATLRTVEAVIPQCPSWVASLGQPWIIAHNGTLQALGETGLVGTAGWFLLYGAAVLGAWKSRWPLARAVTGGLLLINTVDNALLFPSPGYAELFMVVSGAAWARWAAQPDGEQSVGTQQRWSGWPAAQLSLLGAGLAVGTVAVPWLLVTPTDSIRLEQRRLLTPAQYEAGEVYAIYADLSQARRWNKTGYLSLEQCSELSICSRIGGGRFNQGQFRDWVYGRIKREDTLVRLRLTVADTSRLGSALVIKEWKVRRATLP